MGNDGYCVAGQPTLRQMVAANRPSASRPSASRPPTSRPSANRPPANRPPANRPPAKRPSAKRPSANRSSASAVTSVASAVASDLMASAPTSQDARRRARPSIEYADGLLYKCTRCDQMKPVKLLQKDAMGSLGCIEEYQTSWRRRI